jgi:hypothetical protein
MKINVGPFTLNSLPFPFPDFNIISWYSTKFLIFNEGGYFFSTKFSSPTEARIINLQQEIESLSLQAQTVL